MNERRTALRVVAGVSQARDRAEPTPRARTPDQPPASFWKRTLVAAGVVALVELFLSYNSHDTSHVVAASATTDPVPSYGGQIELVPPFCRFGISNAPMMIGGQWEWCPQR